MIKAFKRRWSEDGGYHEVLVIAVPLILSTGAWSLLLFIDRMFLSWYSSDAIAAAMPAGMASFAMMCLFIGTAAYVNTFVAQYFGAGEEHNIGGVIWQGIYFSCLSIFLVIPAYILAEEFFALIGHSESLQLLEVDYFKLLMYSAVFMVLNNTLSSFFSGLGKTLVVMWVSILITMINVLLDYLFIFGKFGFPAMGIKGAATATNIAVITGSMVLLGLIFQSKYRQRFQLLSSWRFDKKLFNRLVYFGFPNGLRLFIDMSAFTAFLMFIGTLGTRELVASNIAFNINALSFLPMVGLMIGVAVVVGQRLGENKPQLAEKATWSAIHIALAFFGVLALLYISIPEVFIYPFTLNGGLGDLQGSEEMIVILLKFIAFFGVFDALFLVFLGALEGAGDTRFVMKMSFIISVILLVIPCYLYIKYFQANIYVLWSMITINVIVYCAVFFLRFYKGPWKTMRVIN
jgi:MATE family multidrug resistance protein|tara:strand:+ start:395 stop:1774 length:1380 start_codon:yes stop_codon:yes gene_type:complete